MIEAALGVSVPDHLVLPGKSRRGREGGVGVIVLAQTYDNVRGQQYLAEVCRRAADHAGVRIIAVEGADDRITPAASPGTSSPAADSSDLREEITQLIKAASQVSAGALALLQREPERFELWGIDDPVRIQRSEAAMTSVFADRAARDAAFESIAQVLDAAQRKTYGPALAGLRMEMMPFAARRATLGDRMGVIETEARRLSVDLRPFPAVQEFARIVATEGKINAGRVTRQQQEFVTRVTRGLAGWFQPKSGGVVTIDRRKLQPVLEFWWEKTGRTRGDYDRLVAAHGLEPALRELREWTDTWLATQAKSAGDQGGAHVFYEELMRLALRLGVPFFDLREFRQQIAMARHLDVLRRNLNDEISSAVRELAGRSNPPSGARLFELEQRLDWLFRALALEVPADEAEQADLTRGRLEEIVNEISAIAGQPVPPQTLTRITALERTLTEAGVFLRLSWERGAIMATRTLERLEELGEDRAVLVAGGFHTRAITHTFGESPHVSWSVLAPSPDLAERAGRRRLVET